MSLQAQALVRNLDMKAPLKPVLMAYANYVDELGYSWAGVETIAFDTGYGVTAVKDARKDLIAAGWMRTKRRFGTSSIVRLNFELMAANQVDRGEGRRICPELEFEEDNRRSAPVSREAAERKPAGQTQLAASRLTGKAQVSDSQPPDGQLDSREAAVYLAASRPLSVSDPSEDPSVEGARHRVEDNEGGREGASPPGEPEPTEDALALIAGLEFGAHRRPSRSDEAPKLALLVDSALTSGLTLVEIRRHAQATINAARSPRERGNAITYLMNGLQPDRLPIPARLPLSSVGDAAPAAEQAAAAPDSPVRLRAVEQARSIPGRKAASRPSKARRVEETPGRDKASPGEVVPTSGVMGRSRR